MNLNCLRPVGLGERHSGQRQLEGLGSESRGAWPGQAGALFGSCGVFPASSALGAVAQLQFETLSEGESYPHRPRALGTRFAVCGPVTGGHERVA